MDTPVGTVVTTQPPAGMVQTVCGPVAPTDLGVTHSHEHVLWDYFPVVNSYAAIHDDEEVATAELVRFREVGGGAVVDASSGGIRVDAGALRRISEASGIHIIAGTGWYRERLYPEMVHDLTSSALATKIVEDITAGFDSSGVRAGVIGEIGTERGGITPAEERVFRAAAKAHRATGVPILTHTTHFGELALEQLELLAEEGVPSDAVIISHLGDRPDYTMLARIAATGAYLSIDNIGYDEVGYPGDDVRAANVMRLLSDGHEGQVVLGTDIASTAQLHRYGGRGYTHLLKSFIPFLDSLGVTEEQIASMTVRNPAQALTVRSVGAWRDMTEGEGQP